MYLSLEKRSLDILRRIIFSGGYIKIQEIADEMQVSKRSVYYDINKINDWLIQHQIDPFVAERNKGILATKEQIQAIQEVLGDSQQKEMCVFSPKERSYLIICSIIVRDHPMYIEQFMDICQVSRNTIINDLKAVSSFLEFYTLSLVYDIKDGYRVVGNPIKKRAVFFMLFPYLWEYQRKKMVHLGNDRRMQTKLEKLRSIEAELNVEYASGVLPSLALFLTTIEKRTDQLTFDDMDKEEIRSTKEYMLGERYFPDLSEEEKIYLTLHLLGSRLQTIPINLMNEQGETYEYARLLVKEFEDVSCIYFTQREELIQAINAHLKTSLYRYRYGIQLGNPLLSSIKDKYEELFELTKKASEVLEDCLGCLISDAEVAYLTLHFGAFLSSKEREGKPKIMRIAIICPNGIGTGNMLRSEVAALVPQATEIKNIPLSQYREDHPYDLIISTVVLSKEKKLIVVHPILTDQDKVTILRHCMGAQVEGRVEIQGIVRLASRYMSKENLEYFQKELQEYYSGVTVQRAPHRDFGKGLSYYLRNRHIQICTQTCTWEEALHLSCKPLLESGAIDSRYIEAVISDQKDKGLSMFLADDIILAHSAIENGVHRLDVALTTFKKPVKFLNGKQAKIIISLCAEDQTKHIRILNDVLNIFSKQKNKDQLLSFSKPEQIQDWIMQMDAQKED